MKRKYLDDVNVNYKHLKSGALKDKKFAKAYGFSKQETYDLEICMVYNLYERLMAYKNLTQELINLDYHIISIDQDTYNLKDWIDILIENCEEIFKLEKDMSLEFEVVRHLRIKDLWILWANLSQHIWW